MANSGKQPILSKPFSDLSTKERLALSRVDSQEFIKASLHLRDLSPHEQMRLLVHWINSFAGNSVESLVSLFVQLTDSDQRALKSPPTTQPA